MNKVFSDAAAALDGLLFDGMTIVAGGFGLCGIPETLIDGILASGVRGITAISNNAGVDGVGLGLLLESRQIAKMISSYVGENKEFERQYLAGELDVEFSPQGTLAERIRAGGAGIPGFYTRTGVGTLVAQGKETKLFAGETYIMETGLTADLAIVKAWKGDRYGNLVYRKSARNFNPVAATAGRVTVAEVEMMVPPEDLDPDEIHSPGIYIQRIIPAARNEKRIERLTISREVNHMAWTRNQMADRTAFELKDGYYVNLGIGIPTLVANYIRPGIDVILHSENGMLGLGPFPSRSAVDPDIINAGKQTITELNHTSYFSSADSFAMIRGGHMDASVLGAMEVSETGDLANWMVPGRTVKGMGGGMDLVAGVKRIIVLMDHRAKDGTSKFRRSCTLPLTGRDVVDMLITDLAVFARSGRGRSFELIELAPGVTLDEVRSSTEAHYDIAPNLQVSIPAAR